MEAIQKYEVSQMAEMERAAMALFQSKFFSDTTSQAQAIVKVMAGNEIGIGPFASMNGIHVIQGKPTYGANILAAKVKGSGKYDYRVLEISEKNCVLEFFQGASTLGKSSFSIEDAKKSGTKNIDKFPRNMLFARAISNGIKWFCPDVLGGVTAYVPEEFGAVVDDNNAIVDVVEGVASNFTPKTTQPAMANPDPVYTGAPDDLDAAFPPMPTEANYFAACEVTASDGSKYGERETAKLAWVANNPKTPQDKRDAASTIIAWRNAHPTE